ncbi:uncharacterized protein RAG0_08314 [Rhynchosporium agropyri]|uniref:Uncharacterized protein n=1 Tax=Rhynchosporium agropyri TaxID=914238 RepID=A0A1E1KQC6_9HELO|nr:uncharacterized protein RAG0_08314 [Rhynchosporium agropyri]
MKELTDYLGMLLEESTPYTPEQYRRAKRSIYTIIEKYLRVLGYPIFILINKEKRVQSYKVAPRAEKGILVGFEGYNIYRYLVNRKVVRTSYLRFNKNGLVIEPYEEDAIIVP